MEQPALSTLVSPATLRNWKRLCDSPVHDAHLSKRANKKLSRKLLFPKEYITNPLNAGTIQCILDKILCENVSIRTAISSLCIALLRQNGLVGNTNSFYATQNPYVDSFVHEILKDTTRSLLHVQLPTDEIDIVGLIYQCLLSEGHKNVKGSYFTPRTIIEAMIADMNTAHATILDPCCGTGSFLLSIEANAPENIYGVDIDPLAVMIAKTNLFLMYKDHEFAPQIYCEDFLLLGHTFFNTCTIPKQYDYIISNPPWGATVSDECRVYYPEVTSGESFSYFIYQSMSWLKSNGDLRFLLPESLLNVKTHQDIRQLILKRTSIKNLMLFDRCFSGVYTPAVGIQLANNNVIGNIITIEKGDEKIHCEQGDYLRNDHYVFSITNDIDSTIIETTYRHPHQTLSGSKWALGIVTGNNKEKVHQFRQTDMEPIYTGKDVNRYTLKVPTSYILYDRAHLQQVAPDELYRAKEKLVYKFISDRLVFAYDDTGSLFLNSANVLIPNIDGMSMKTVMAFLNSTILQYLYIKKFGEIKILRGNLEKLPFPNITKILDAHLSELVDAAIAGNKTVHNEIQKIIYDIWELNEQQIAHIERVVHG